MERYEFEDGSVCRTISLGRLELIWSVRGPRPRHSGELARNGVQLGRLSVLWGR